MNVFSTYSIFLVFFDFIFSLFLEFEGILKILKIYSSSFFSVSTLVIYCGLTSHGEQARSNFSLQIKYKRINFLNENYFQIT